MLDSYDKAWMQLEITALFVDWKKENDAKLAEILKNHSSGQYYQAEKCETS